MITLVISENGGESSHSVCVEKSLTNNGKAIGSERVVTDECRAVLIGCITMAKVWYHASVGGGTNSLVSSSCLEVLDLYEWSGKCMPSYPANTLVGSPDEATNLPHGVL